MNKQKEKEVAIKSPLQPGTVVTIRPVIWGNRSILFRAQGDDPQKNAGGWLHDGGKIILGVPRSGQHLVDPLDDDERKFFEEKLGFKNDELNPRKKGNYWEDFSVVLRKPHNGPIKDTVVIAELDLGSVEDYLKWKVLKLNSRKGGVVAPSWDKRFARGTYSIALTDSKHVYKENIERHTKLKEVMNFIGEIDYSAEKMYEFLMIFYYLNTDALKPDPNPKGGKEWFVNQIQNLQDTRLNDMHATIKKVGADYDLMAMVINAISKGHLVYDPQDGMISTLEGEPVGNSIEKAVINLKDEKHQMLFMKLKSKMEDD